jgi:glycosyltransferase involved in cell wall biosynthesis
VTSNLSSLPEVAGDAALLVDPRSTAELSGAMARLAQDGALAATLVQKGRARAAHMTWEACAAQTLEAYRMAL